MRISYSIGFFLFAYGLNAQPQNPHALQGKIDLHELGKELQISASNKAVVDWPSFSILDGEIIKIALPNETSSMLNRVTSQDPSLLMGSLLSNGQIYLINPNGIVIGKDAKINCNEFIASTLNLDVQSFAKGEDFIFEGDSTASILNQGSIECEGNIFFIGLNLINQGNVKSESGDVFAAAGSSIFIQGAHSKQVFVHVKDLPSSIENQGLIEAVAVELQAKGNDPLALAINNTGVVRATRFQSEGGRILLKAESGSISVGNTLQAEGGSIVVTARHIQIDETARIDASGEKSGGKIYIGGGWQGSDLLIPNSETVAVAKGAVISADALSEGNGGSIVVWGDSANHFYGHVSAKGAQKGGQIEISSRDGLIFDGTADLSSLSGLTGNLLLDPVSIVIQAASPDIDGNGSAMDITSAAQLNNALTTPAGFPNANSIITAGAVNGLLTGGVTMILAAQSFITVNAPVTASGVVTSLTLNAPTVNLNQPITFPTGGVLLGSATTVNVGAPPALIQNGIDASASGATVNIGAGTYVDPLFILNKALTLNGSGVGVTIVQCPSYLTNPLTNTFPLPGTGTGVISPIIMASGSNAMNVQNLTVDGNNQGGTIASITQRGFTGIGYFNSSGTVNNVHIENMSDQPPGTSGQQRGNGVVAGISTGMTASVTVSNSVIDTFQKNAIVISQGNFPGSMTGTITGNTITGPTPFSQANENGIEIVDGATGTISNNTISNIINGSDSGVAIFIVDSGTNTIISGNSVNSSDYGLYAFQSGDNLQVLGNAISNGFYGIYLEDNSGSSTVSSNVLTNNSLAAITLQTDAFLVIPDPLFHLNSNQISGGGDGLDVFGTTTDGPIVVMNGCLFSNIGGNYISLVDDPNDIWPSTSTVSFDGAISGYNMTYAQFLAVTARIIQSPTPASGVVLLFLTPTYMPVVPVPSLIPSLFSALKLFPQFPLYQTFFPRLENPDWVYEITYLENPNNPVQYKNGLFAPIDLFFHKQGPFVEGEL